MMTHTWVSPNDCLVEVERLGGIVKTGSWEIERRKPRDVDVLITADILVDGDR